VVMSSVEGAASGIASGILNTSRQIGTSVGLAVLGSVGVTVAVRHWDASLGGLTSAAARTAGSGLANQVAGGQFGTVRHQLGASATGRAAAAFEAGLQVALLAGAGVLLAGGVLALVVLRRPGVPVPHASGRRRPEGVGGHRQ